MPTPAHGAPRRPCTAREGAWLGRARDTGRPGPSTALGGQRVGVLHWNPLHQAMGGRFPAPSVLCGALSCTPNVVKDQEPRSDRLHSRERADLAGPQRSAPQQGARPDVRAVSGLCDRFWQPGWPFEPVPRGLTRRHASRGAIRVRGHPSAFWSTPLNTPVSEARVRPYVAPAPEGPSPRLAPWVLGALVLS